MKTEAALNWRTNLERWKQFLQSAIERYEADEDIGTSKKYKRQLQALYDLSYGLMHNASLLKFLMDPNSMPEWDGEGAWSEEIDFFNPSLDEAQRAAVAACLRAPHAALVQGPPGTGKTSVITEVCMQILMHEPGKRILICSETHVAVNNVLDRLLAKMEGIRAIRVASDEEKVSRDPRIQAITTTKILNQYVQSLPQLDVPSELVEQLQGVFSENLAVTAWQLMRSADVVGITCNGVGRYRLEADEEPFHYVILDEVCKATFPEVMMPLLLAEKAILVGDPQQLPPTFCQEEREVLEELDLQDEITNGYVDDVFERVPASCKAFLNRQYRMTDEIGDLISREFYEGRLENGARRSDPESLVWLDYATEQNYPARFGDPILNPVEVEIIHQVLAEYHYQVAAERGEVSLQTPLEIAVITPYKPQMRALRKRIDRAAFPHFSIQIDTIDSFQGKDADGVLFSVTRTGGSTRFFADQRRLNVALSRAKRKLWLVGSGKFLQRVPVLHRIYNSVPVRMMSWMETKKDSGFP